MATTTIALEWDRSQIKALADQGLTKALVRALSKAGRDGIRTVKSASVRQVRMRKRLKVSRINRSLHVSMPRGANHIDDLSWRLGVDGKMVPLYEYGAKQTKRGVTVRVNKGGARKLVKGAFIATVGNGHKGVFQRRGPKRLPIKELFSSRVVDVFKDGGFIPAVLKQGNDAFQRTLTRVLPLEIAKIKP